MPKFKVTDSKTGKSYVITAPDQASAVSAFQKFQGSNAAGAVQQPHVPANDLGMQGLPIPGTQPPPGAPAINEVPPNQHFGFSSGDTLNPLPALSAMGDSMAGNLPLGGQALKDWRDRTNAAVWGTTPEQSRAAMNETAAKNPEASIVGAVAGQTLPYMAAAELPLLRGVLGFEGPLGQRLAMTGASQYAINTGDNLSRGQDPMTAAANGAAAAAASLPFALLGKGKGTSQAQQDAVNVLKREGIPLTGGQMRGSKALMTMESQLGGGATSAVQEKQLSALTKAALKRAGIDAAAATPPVLQGAYDELGSRFDNLARMTTVKVDTALQNDLIGAATKYQQLVGQPAPIVEGFINRVGSLAQQNGGVLKGDNYKVLITDLREAAKTTSSNEVRTALNDMRTAIDDAVERSMGGQTRAAWQKVRQQYKNLIHVTDAVAGAGEPAAKGYMTPQSLRQAISTGDKRNYAKGYGDLNELSHAANAVMVKIPDSGTAGRLASIAGMSAIPAAGAALASGNIGHAASLAAGLALPSIAGHAMLSAPGRALIGRGGSSIPAAVARGMAPRVLPSILQMLGGASGGP